MFFRERKRFDAIAVGVGLTLRGAPLAQLVLDDAHLFAQVGLAVAAIDVGLDLPLQLAVDRGPPEVA
jgi:hypothetical protein